MTANRAPFLHRIFLHFFDRYHGRLARLSFRYPFRLIVQEQRLAFRLAFLLSDELYLSGSAYFENPLTRRILREHRGICEAGFVFLTARDLELIEHFERKRAVHYGRGSPGELRASYQVMPRMPVLYRSTSIYTARSIRQIWTEAVESGNLVDLLRLQPGFPVRARLEEIWARMPESLEGSAFVAPHVMQEFVRQGVTPPSELRIMKFLDPGYTLSHTSALDCGIVNDLMYLQTPWDVRASRPGVSYKNTRSVLLEWDILDQLEQAPSDRLLKARMHPAWAAAAHALNTGDPRRREIAEQLDEVRRILSGLVLSRSAGVRRDLSQVGVVTALPEEWLAVVVALSAKEVPSVEHDPNRYAIAQVSPESMSGAQVDVIVTFLPRMGTNSAAAAATNLMRSFPNVNDLIFSGIACGVPNVSDQAERLRLGDLVISDSRGVVQVDHQAIKERGTENRGNMPPPSRRLLNCVRLLQADEMQEGASWRGFLQEIISSLPRFVRPDESTDVVLDDVGNPVPHPIEVLRERGIPKVVHGAIGSSNTLFRNKSLRDRLARKHKVRAFEMEGAGTAEAVWQFGKSYLLVRSICDYGDDRTKDDTWHNYAAAAAAAYTKAVLLRL